MIWISTTSEKRKTSVEWPTPVDDRLRLLVELVRQSGALGKPSSANELLAALVCTQPVEFERLARVINAYRNIDLDALAEATTRHGGALPPRRGRPRATAASAEGNGRVSAVSWATSPAIRRSMQANRSRDTRSELAVRRAAHALGLRYRVAVPSIPALRRTADMVFPRAKVAVFVDGCFWHGCVAHYRKPARNHEYWSAKIERNQIRDRHIDTALRDAGWVVVRVWEHEDPKLVAARLKRVVHSRSRN